MKGNRKYSDEELLEALKEHPDLSKGEWRKRGIRPSAGTISQRMGSWNKARKKAGLNIKKRKWSRERIIEELRKRDKESSGPLKAGENPALQQMAQRYFGSWNNAKRTADVEIIPRGHFHSGPTRKDKMKEMVQRRKVITAREILGTGRFKGQNITDLERENENINSISLSGTGNKGSAKYGATSIIDLNPSIKIYYTDERALADFLEDHIRFNLSGAMEFGRKNALSHYLKGRVPDRVFRYLHSLYTQSTFSWNGGESRNGD